MVRPDRVELPTFWFVGMQSDRILLVLMPATTHFEANTWRTTAAIDERLMKGFSRDQLLQINSLRLLPPRVRRGAVGQKDDLIWSSHTVVRWPDHKSILR